MKLGKVSESILKRSVLKYTNIKKANLNESCKGQLLNGAGVGEDCAVFSWSEDALVLTAGASGTYAAPHQMEYAMHRAANNIYAAGGIPESAILHIMMPDHLREAKLKYIMEEAHEVALKLGITLAGGHTEVTDAVNRPCVSVTMLGSKDKMQNRVFHAKAGEDIVMTKWAGMAGTLQLTDRYADSLSERFSAVFLHEIEAMREELSIATEAADAVKSGISGMHDVAEGGVFAALWELAEKSGTGLLVDLKKIPIRQETIEICNHLDRNPYELMGTGSLLITCENGYHLVECLQRAGIMASVIGKTTDGHDRLLVNDDEKRFLEPARNEELFAEEQKNVTV